METPNPQATISSSTRNRKTFLMNTFWKWDGGLTLVHLTTVAYGSKRYRPCCLIEPSTLRRANCLVDARDAHARENNSVPSASCYVSSASHWRSALTKVASLAPPTSPWKLWAQDRDRWEAMQNCCAGHSKCTNPLSKIPPCKVTKL
eukprot:6134656-Amphidinium_carterae.1